MEPFALASWRKDLNFRSYLRCRLTRKQPWDDDPQVKLQANSEHQSNLPTFARLDGSILPHRFPPDAGGRPPMDFTPPQSAPARNTIRVLDRSPVAFPSTSYDSSLNRPPSSLTRTRQPTSCSFFLLETWAPTATRSNAWFRWTDDPLSNLTAYSKALTIIAGRHILKA